MQLSSDRKQAYGHLNLRFEILSLIVLYVFVTCQLSLQFDDNILHHDQLCHCNCDPGKEVAAFSSPNYFVDSVLSKLFV